MTDLHQDLAEVDDGVAVWRHRPTEKQVIRWTGRNFAQIRALHGDKVRLVAGQLVVVTEQGEFTAGIGDYIVCETDDIGGEAWPYPCPTERFLALYELVGEGS